MREKDEDVEALAIQKVGKAIEHGNVPTAKQVKHSRFFISVLLLL